MSVGALRGCVHLADAEEACGLCGGRRNNPTKMTIEMENWRDGCWGSCIPGRLRYVISRAVVGCRVGMVMVFSCSNSSSGR
jgi:hypothetical protein